jgi:GNAT superfamily N-acetyltransferase
MPEHLIEQIVIPDSLDGPEAADFIAANSVRNVVETDLYGTDELSQTAAEDLPWWHDEFEPTDLFAVRVDGAIVGIASRETRPQASSTMAWVRLQVLPGFRRLGIGTALADHVEALALSEGQTELVSYAASKGGGGERLQAPTSFGSVPAGNAEVRFLLSRGYRLEQVVRVSRLALPVAASFPPIADGYLLHQWSGATPERWLDDLATLFMRMSTDAPNAALDEPEDPWTVGRVLALDERARLGGRTALMTAIEHEGVLVGVTCMVAPREITRSAIQWDTIVLGEHRGHSLGMVLKAANLRLLQNVAPGHPSIITFNAEENRHMLAVNETLGFVPIGYEGAWKCIRETRVRAT